MSFKSVKPNLINNYLDELKALLGKEVNIIIDRPIHSNHPKHDDIVYPINYGYITNLKAPDGEYQDAYLLGINKKVESSKGVVIAIIERFNDNEAKIVVVPNGLEYTDEEIEELLFFQEKFFKHRIIR